MTEKFGVVTESLAPLIKCWAKLTQNMTTGSRADGNGMLQDGELLRLLKRS